MRRILILVISFIGLFSCHSPKKIKVFMAGDSTMQTNDTNKTLIRGWGQLFQEAFDTSRVEIINHAIGGRSTKSFKKDGRWERLLSEVQQNDYVIIQFGHNDASINKPERYTPPSDYKENLIGFVKDVSAKGAVPILVTPIVMRRFDEEGQFKDGHGQYPDKMREVASEYEVALIDMHQMSMELVSRMGEDNSKKLYMNLLPNEHPAYPDGLNDNTHLREEGARAMVGLAVKGIERLGLTELLECMKN